MPSHSRGPARAPPVCSFLPDTLPGAAKITFTCVCGGDGSAIYSLGDGITPWQVPVSIWISPGHLRWEFGQDLGVCP